MAKIREEHISDTIFVCFLALSLGVLMIGAAISLSVKFYNWIN